MQLFDQHARAVKATFALTADNVADVVAVCTRLDGLPLAIELAAARSKLLTPKALLTRLDRALDLAAASGQVPSRQKTLRDTIGWSYDLLTPTQQILLPPARRVLRWRRPRCRPRHRRRSDTSAEVLDLVSDLVDASLVDITEDLDGEPRIRLLETIRAYALDQLDTSGERALVQQRHAQHYTRRSGKARTGVGRVSTTSRREAGSIPNATISGKPWPGPSGQPQPQPLTIRRRCDWGCGSAWLRGPVRRARVSC